MCHGDIRLSSNLLFISSLPQEGSTEPEPGSFFSITDVNSFCLSRPHPVAGVLDEAYSQLSLLSRVAAQARQSS
jgi:hypothetical protein